MEANSALTRAMPWNHEKRGQRESGGEGARRRTRTELAKAAKAVWWEGRWGEREEGRTNMAGHDEGGCFGAQLSKQALESDRGRERPRPGPGRGLAVMHSVRFEHPKRPWWLESIVFKGEETNKIGQQERGGNQSINKPNKERLMGDTAP